jgi:Ser-tRNA(Ala) deacylase AlaX
MQTKLLYLNDTYLFNSESEIIGFGHDERGAYALLSETICYPQGGGQPSDYAFFRKDSQEAFVKHISFTDGEVRHYGNFENFTVGGKIRLDVDAERRIKNAKLHTLGHLLASIVIEDYQQPWQAVKGYHFSEGPYVEFIGEKFDDSDEFIQMLEQSLMANCWLEKSNVVTEEISPDTLLQRDAYLPSNFKIPEGKPLRIVSINGYRPVPCGGTHIKSLSEIKVVKITKIKVKDQAIRICYTGE